MKRFFKEQLFPVVMIIIGAACAAFSIECFLIPNTILDGGVTGVSMMISYLSGIRLSILVIIINIPFFFVGYKALGKGFLFRAVIAMAAFSGFLEVCKLIPTVTSSELLAVVFGGVLLGIGVGTVLRHGGCLDGTEIAAMLLSKNVSASTGQIIFMINIFIYISAGILFGWDRAMLSLLTYFITFKLIDIVQEAYRHRTGGHGAGQGRDDNNRPRKRYCRHHLSAARTHLHLYIGRGSGVRQHKNRFVLRHHPC